LIDRLNAILNDEGVRMQIIKDELTEIRERYGDERRTEVVQTEEDITVEDMIAERRDGDHHFQPGIYQTDHSF
jgi:DNA gyrase subunit A